MYRANKVQKISRKFHKTKSKYWRQKVGIGKEIVRCSNQRNEHVQKKVLNVLLLLIWHRHRNNQMNKKSLKWMFFIRHSTWNSEKYFSVLRHHINFYILNKLCCLSLECLVRCIWPARKHFLPKRELFLNNNNYYHQNENKISGLAKDFT